MSVVADVVEPARGECGRNCLVQVLNVLGDASIRRALALGDSGGEMRICGPPKRRAARRFAFGREERYLSGSWSPHIGLLHGRRLTARGRFLMASLVDGRSCQPAPLIVVSGSVVAALSGAGKVDRKRARARATA